MSTHPVIIQFQANTQQALQGLSMVSQGLQSLAMRPLQLATMGFRSFGLSGTEALQGLRGQLGDVEAQWSQFTGLLGVPLSLAGVWGAVSGIKSLKNALIDTNVEMEMSRTRLSALMKDWNDTKMEGWNKSVDVTKFIEKYGVETPFTTQGLVDASVQGASAGIKDPETMKTFLKMSGKLAAGAGQMNPTNAAYAIQAAMNGNTASLQMTYGLNASNETLAMMSSLMKDSSGHSLANTMQGKMMAIQKLINMRYGQDDQIITDLSNTGAGVMSTISDAIATPFRYFAEPAYNEGVKGLVAFKDALLAFENSKVFMDMQKLIQDTLLPFGVKFGDVMRKAGEGLSTLPGLVQKYGPMIKRIAEVTAVVVGLHAAIFVLRGAMLLTVNAGLAFMGMIAPLAAIFMNPLLLTGVLALGGALYPFIDGLKVAGKTVDEWLIKAGELSQKKDWAAFFTEPLKAVREFITGLQEGKEELLGLSEAGSKSVFFERMEKIFTPVLKGFKKAIVEVFPELKGIPPLLDRFAGSLGKLEPYVPIILKVVGAITGLMVAGRVLSALGPLFAMLSGIGGALATVGSGIAALASPALLAGLLAVAAVLSPLMKDIDIGGKNLSGWMDRLRDKVEGFNWQKIFELPAKGIRWVLDQVGKVLKDPLGFWKDLFTPSGILGRLEGLFTPIWEGLLKSMDKAFPELRGFFATFGNAGEVAMQAIQNAGNLLLPVLEGMWKVLEPVASVLIKVAAELAKVAWNLMTDAFFAMSRALSNPETRKDLENFGKILGGIVLLKGAGVVQRAIATGIAAAAPAMPAITGAASFLLTNPVGITITAATIMAAAVTMFTNKTYENSRAKLLLESPSTIKRVDGLVTKQDFGHILAGSYAGDQGSDEATASMIGLIQSMTNTNYGRNWSKDAGNHGLNQKGVNDAKELGEDIGTRFRQALEGMGGEFAAGKLPEKQKLAYTAATESLDQLTKMINAGEDDPKKLAKAYDRMIRNIRALAQMRKDFEKLIPDVIDQDVKIDVGGGVAPASRYALPPGLGRDVQQLMQLLPYMVSDEKWFGPTADVGGGISSHQEQGFSGWGTIEKLEVHVPLTIYAQDVKQLDARELEKILVAMFPALFQQHLWKALNNQGH